jgi:broad specificity phosphatase PhoE
MITDRASLRRQPLFTPIWLAALGAFLGLIVLACATWVWATADSTTVVLVAEGERQPDAGAGVDPPLTPAGEARAARLAELFGDGADSGHIDAIYVAPTGRGRMTVLPLAGKLGLTPVVAAGAAPAALARRVQREHPGRRILIVAPGATLNELVEALGGDSSAAPGAAADHNTLYIVCVPRIGRTNVLHVNF